MKLKRLTLALLVVALVSGGAAAYGARDYIVKTIADHRAEIEAQYETVRVVVPVADLPPRTALNSSHIVAREVPKAYLHRDTIPAQRWKDYIGRQSRTALTAGAPLLTSQLLDPHPDALSEVLEPGKRALTVPVDQISSISGLLSPGDRVDILLTLTRNQRKQTFPLMKDIRVLATGFTTEPPSAQQADARPQRFTTVTMLVTPDQAARIVHARGEGALTVVLRADGDPTDGWPTKVTLSSLLGIDQPRPKRQPPRLVQIILGGE